jgi:D-beta-D-heptose 7-phosphate kinase / D-beta-D-heptose 1-phosphate adenosyltransferase
MTLVVLGDSLLDRDVHGTSERLSPDAPTPVLDEAFSMLRPGGAALAAALASRDGEPVTLVTALGDDDAATDLRAELELHRVQVIDVGLEGATPEKIRFFASGHQLLRLDRGAGRAGGRASATARAAIGWADAVLVSDYGRGVAADPQLREALAELPAHVPLIWDPHPRGAPPVPGVTVATPNRSELNLFAPRAALAERTPGIAALGEALRAFWRSQAVCVTRGSHGALLVTEGGETLSLPAVSSEGGDPCGAGDRFASRLASLLARGKPLPDAAKEAVATASAYVARGGACNALRDRATDGAAAGSDAVALAHDVRARGGTVVATGGCFDLLHAGHVTTLAAARQLGDCLIVCLNSDASVRRLKGRKRPLMPEHDRASLLTALSSVDAVAVFDEDNPAQLLAKLRPHVWAKGGDYHDVRLPEAAVLAEWGGRVVLLPYIQGRSTTKLIEEAATGA